MKAIPVLIMPLIIVGGVLSGVFTATESGNIAAVYAFILSVFFYREYTMKDIFRIFVNSAVTISMALLVISTATSLSWILAACQLPQMILNIITLLTNSPVVFLLLLNILLLIAGMFLDPGAAIILLVPVLGPMGYYFGIDPLHLAMIICLNLTLGVVTPPVGVCLYVGASIGKITIDRVVKAIMPFIVVELLVLLLITYFPWISMLIPKMLGYI
jgi:C4-dicarboxylate transporter DctM subunit